MANEQLDSFLDSQTTPEPAAPPQPPPTPQPAPTPPPTPTPEPAQPSKKEDDDDITALAGEDGRTVPFSAFEKVRNDWRGKYIAKETEAALLAKQLEEARRPPPQAAPPPQPAIPRPDPRTDPEGALAWQAEQNRLEAVNEKLNMSEYFLRKEVGAEGVTAYVNEFREMLAKDPTLLHKLHAQPMPYQWMQEQIDQTRAHREIGTDPAAYRARIIAEERAKWEAEHQQPPTPVSPAAGMPPSLANVRSAAARSAPVWTGPTSDADVVNEIRNRRSRR